MKKRVTLLLVLAIALATAPAAMANHCKRCRPLWEACQSGLTSGFVNCVWDDSINNCVTSTSCSHALSAQIEPLASEFAVASVERLDEPQSNPTDTRVASLETAPTADR
ncbi:MAG TPA: hypothetical protein VF608_08850 [Thermoanaerobaculia bacterium]